MAHRPQRTIAECPNHDERSAGGGRGGGGGSAASGGRGGTQAAAGASGPLANAHQDFNEQRLIFKGVLDPSVNNSGYAGVTRVVRDGGSARMDGDTLVIENASSVMLLTRIEYFPDYSEEQVEAVRQAVEELTPDYAALLERARKVQSEMLNRVTVDFGGASKYGLSSEELLSDQRSSPGYSGAFLEKFFEMCRYWFILTSGKYCSMSAETNANINLQIAPGVQGDHREGDGRLLQLDGEPVPGLPHQRKEHLRHARHPLFPHADQRRGRRNHVRPRRFDRPAKHGRIPTGLPPEAGVCARSGTTIW